MSVGPRLVRVISDSARPVRSAGCGNGRSATPKHLTEWRRPAGGPFVRGHMSATCRPCHGRKRYLVPGLQSHVQGVQPQAAQGRKHLDGLGRRLLRCVGETRVTEAPLPDGVQTGSGRPWTTLASPSHRNTRRLGGPCSRRSQGLVHLGRDHPKGLPAYAPQRRRRCGNSPG
jgi:hypothetical protein